MLEDRDLRRVFDLAVGEVDLAKYSLSYLHYLGRVLIYALCEGIIEIGLTERGVREREALEKRLKEAALARKRASRERARMVDEFCASEEPLRIRVFGIGYEFYDSRFAVYVSSWERNFEFVGDGQKFPIRPLTRRGRLISAAILRRARVSALKYIGEPRFDRIYKMLRRYSHGNDSGEFRD